MNHAVLTGAVLPLLLLLALPAVVQAQWNYSTTSGKVTIDKYVGSDSAVTIPSTLDGYPVISIGHDAFYANYGVTNVTIPTGVTTIGYMAFDNCINLTSITIGSSVTSIGDGAFNGCASLASVTIPRYVTGIGAGSFAYCVSLTNIMVNALNSTYTSIAGVLFDKNIKTLIAYPGGMVGGYAVPTGVTSIFGSSLLWFGDGGGAFRGCANLTSVTFPSSLTNIGEYAFSDCTGLTNVMIGTKVTDIGSWAFGDCTSLTDVTIPNSLTSIRDNSFYNCSSLTNITIGTNITSIGSYAFYQCVSLPSVTIPASVTNIGGFAFDRCTSLTAITVDASNSFYCSVAGVFFNKSTNTLIQCPAGKTGSYTIPDSVTNIETEAFYQCSSLTGVTIGNRVATIGDRAFYGCESLTDVAIPDSVTSIGDYAFYQCTSLTSAMIGNGVTSIGRYMFYSCGSLINVIIPNSVTSIGDNAFYWCGSLTDVTIPDSVTGIGSYAFYQCASLTNVTIGNSVAYIGGGAFWSCTSLTSVTIGNSVTSIGWDAFDHCTSLTSITIPNSLISIEISAFDYCISLKSVTIPNNVTSIGDLAFADCSSLTNITIGNSVTSLGDSAFYYCTSLTGVYFRGNAPSLDIFSDTFYGDAKVTVYYYSGTTGWGPTFAGRPTVMLDGTEPTPAITTPTDGQHWSNAVFVVAGTTSDNVQVSNVWFQVNSNGWQLVTTLDNWTNWTAMASLIPGTNVIQVYAEDTAGNVSTNATVNLVYVVTDVLHVAVTGNGTLSPNYSNAVLEIGRNYSMTATAGTGFVFTNWIISTNWLGGRITNNATVQFMMASNLTLQATFADIVKPALSITNLTAGQRWSNAVFTVKGIASDNVEVFNIWLQLNSGEWMNATTANGWTNWSAALNLSPGTNTFAAYAVDTTGNVSITNSQNFQFVVTNVLSVKAAGLGTISPNYSNSWLEIGRNYSITSSPASGFVATNWVISTNWLGGVTTNNAVVRFMMASNLTLQVNFADVTRPTNTITSPAAGQHMTNALATIVGTAKDNWKVLGVWYQLNNGAWNAPATTNGWTNWTTTLQLTIGTNTVKAYAMDLGGNFSTTNSLSVVSSNTFKLQLAFTDTVPLKTNGLVFSLQLSTGLNGHIQVSTNLTTWTTLTNFIGTNTTLNFRDPAATNFSQRYYRAVVP